MELFLTKDELVQLTGRKQRQKQLQQLGQMHIPFFCDAFGWPKVLRKTIDGSNEMHKADRTGAVQSINIDKLNSAGY